MQQKQQNKENRQREEEEEAEVVEETKGLLDKSTTAMVYGEHSDNEGGSGQIRRSHPVAAALAAGDLQSQLGALLQSRALRVCLVLTVAHQLTGAALLTTDTAQLLATINPSIDVANFAPVIGVIHMAGVSLALLLLPIFPRRHILLVSLAGMTALLFVCALLFSLPSRHNSDGDGSGGSVLLPPMLLPMARTAVCGLFLFVYEAGVAPLFWVLVNELFPLELRATGASACVMAQLSLNAGVAALGPFLSSSTIAPMFVAFGCVGAVCWAYLLRHCPETKDRTLSQIQDQLSLA
jgi:MFS family permease